MKLSSTHPRRLLPRFNLWLSLLMVCCLNGCRTTVPIYVWRSPDVVAESHSRIAVAALSSDPLLAEALEAAVLEQRPTARADIALLTSQQLIESAPVRVASTSVPTGWLRSDLDAIRAANNSGADLLLFGQVYSHEIDWYSDSEAVDPATTNMNQAFFKRLGAPKEKGPGYHIMMSWNVIDVPTGKSLGSKQFRVHSDEVLEKYPDLQQFSEQPSYQLVTAAARETWRAVAPSVEKAEVRLASPWVQPGSWRVLLGVKAAKSGQWQLAESHWNRAARWWLPTPAAHHNLAVAHAAREDFVSAKSELLKADGLMSIRLPEETLVWLDHHHRLYNRAHLLGSPAEGWAFPDAVEQSVQSYRMSTVQEDQMPWWAGLPGTRYRPQAASTD